MSTPWSDMPPWLLRLLADTTPERAVETAIRAYRLRGIEFQSRNEAGDLTLETTCRWIRSGSRLLHLVEEDTFTALAHLGDEPRWHALTTPEPGPVYVVRRDELGVRSALAPEGPGGLSDYIDTLARVRVLDGGHYTDPLIAVQPSPDGPIVTAWIRQTTGEWATALGVSGSWDLFRWAHLRSRGADEPFSAIWMLNLNAVLNAVAAIIEAREVVRVQAARKRRKGARGARKGRGVRPEVYRLDPHALSSWTERVVRETPSDAPRRSPASTDVPRTVRLHTCREHTRRTWVLSPAEGEPVVETRLGRERQDGTRATLYCVMRRVQAHARGTGIAPRPIRLVPSD